MSYSIETYDKAQNILDRRKEKATLEAQSRVDKLCAEIPELNVINRKLAQIGLNISRTFFTSKDPQADINKLRIESLALQEEKKNGSQESRRLQPDTLQDMQLWLHPETGERSWKYRKLNNDRTGVIKYAVDRIRNRNRMFERARRGYCIWVSWRSNFKCVR